VSVTASLPVTLGQTGLALHGELTFATVHYKPLDALVQVVVPHWQLDVLTVVPMVLVQATGTGEQRFWFALQ